MFVATGITSVLLAVLLTYSATRKLTHRPEVVATYRRVGVPEDKLNYLAIILLTGAAGLLAGLLAAPVGIAAAIGLICYFTAAIGFHIRFRDTGNLPTPVLLALLAAATLTLHLLSP